MLSLQNTMCKGCNAYQASQRWSSTFVCFREQGYFHKKTFCDFNLLPKYATNRCCSNLQEQA